ncbi:MAG: glycosyltransferase family 39 protein [Planctomycetota bacterium]|nr:glycosyltransferase family 39 protein [Planctomycetota bacterium]MDA1211541.1 glycosyltransferase family 39 protein [Planctomycetota bacterium]
MTTTTEPILTSKPTRREWIFIVVLTLVAFALRGGGLSRVSVEHFDEAIYASNLLFGESEGYGYPQREFFAPPLFPFLVELTMIIAGVSGQSAMYANVLFGTLTIPLLWFVGRTWFGPVCGCVAAFIACGYDFHIFYSRTAFTDISLCFWWLLAVWAYERSFTFRSWKYALAAGLFSGLAWATKYNGWITWLIALTGGLGYVLFSIKDEPLARRLKLWVMVCSVSAVTMLACWYPVWTDLQNVGGYSAVAVNHQGYFVGVAGWWDSLLSHVKTQRTEQGVISVFVWTFVVTWTGAIFVRYFIRRDGRTQYDGLLLWLLLFGPLIALLYLGGSIGFATAAVGYSVITLINELWDEIRLFRTGKNSFDHTSPKLSIAATWLLGSWLLGLLVTTPFYQPYARLSLPLITAGLLGLSSLFAGVVAMLRDEFERRLCRRLAIYDWRMIGTPIVLSLTIAIVSGAGAATNVRPFPAWQSRLGLEIASNEIAEAILNDSFSRETIAAKDQAIVYVWGEPAVVFHLRAVGWPLVAPVASTSFLEPNPGAPDLPTYLVVGPHFQKDVSDGVYDITTQLTLVDRFPYQPSDLIAFDEQPPQEFGQAVSHEDEMVSLFRIK